LCAISKAALINLIVCNFHASIQVNGSDKLWKSTGWMHGENNEKWWQCRSLFLDNRYFSVFLNIVSVSVF